jgi:hypothetical protein
MSKCCCRAPSFVALSSFPGRRGETPRCGVAAQVVRSLMTANRLAVCQSTGTKGLSVMRPSAERLSPAGSTTLVARAFNG